MQYNIRGDAEGLWKQSARRLPEEGLKTLVEMVTILATLKNEDGDLANDLAADGVWFYVQCGRCFDQGLIGDPTNKELRRRLEDFFSKRLRR